MPPSYFQFLAACLRGDHNLAGELLSNRHWSWECLLEKAKDEFILPAVAESIQELSLSHVVPIEVTDLLAAVDSLNAERNQVIVNEIHTVCKLLNGGGIEPVLLKGVAYLAAGVYRNPAARYLGDIDLLIPAAQIQSASNLLGRNGYRQDESDQFAGFRHHHPPLRRPGSVFIELHHSVGMGPCASLLPADEIFLESGAYDLGGVQVKLPAPNQLAIHLIAHSQIQHSYNERIWPPLRAMYDLALLQGRYEAVLDWKEIEMRFRRARRFGVLALHAFQLRETLGVELPLPLEMRGLMGLRWQRRRFLRRFPALRYLDPIYMSATVLTRRMRLLRRMLSEQDGRTHLAKQLLTAGLYKRFATDVMEGRGR
jgi:Uncharacterised nucleotidyltransferase